MIYSPELLFPSSEKVTLAQGKVVCHTHSRVQYVYLLEEGTVEYFHTDEQTLEKTQLLSTSEKGMIIGWECLTPTQRSIAGVEIISDEATLLKIPKQEFLDNHTTQVLQETCRLIYSLLKISIHKQANLLSSRVKQRAAKLENYFISAQSTIEERILLLRMSPFFGEFADDEISALASLMRRREYEPSELIYEQDASTEGIFILIEGEVSIKRQQGERFLNLRSISTPGYIFGWSAVFDQTDICRASTEFKTSVYFIPNSELAPLIEKKKFGSSFFQMLIWLMGNQLQLSHSWYISLLDNHNLLSVKQLIEINTPRIPIQSPLHQIPFLLQNNATLPLAFSTLHDLQKSGTKQERHLSSICLDLLKGEEREWMFLNSIAEVYETVAQGEPEHAEENRKRCASQTRAVFEHVSYHIEGQENLPESPGHIFIYNHLLNHPKYTLNNRFQLTLDSHFISAKILDEKYDDPGMRTVRFGKSFEYGHQEYYQNLGYIEVYTKDSDMDDEQAKAAAKDRFYSQAEGYLSQGTNLIISPEGTSFPSENSPGRFKMGVFNLIDQMEYEPYIVPVVFYNFDKRITESLYFCRILQPFKLSEKKPVNQSLKDFAYAYQQEFSAEVIRAGEDADILLNHLNK